MNPIDLKALQTQAFQKLDKDERRARLFVVAAANKTVELSLTGDPQKVAAFALASSELAGKWAAKVKKLGFGDLFRDPFKDLREQTRNFSKSWDMDAVLIKELG